MSPRNSSVSELPEEKVVVKPFLKRTSSAVPRQKLDWSKVRPRTNSSNYSRPFPSKLHTENQILPNFNHSPSIRSNMSTQQAWTMEQLQEAVAEMCKSKIPSLVNMKCNKELYTIFSKSSTSQVPRLHKHCRFFKDHLREKKNINE